MKLVLLSDTHGQHRNAFVPPGDVLIHCGDLTLVGEPYLYEDVADWFAHQPHAHKICIFGNHDFNGERDGRPALESAGLTVLQDSGCEIEGIKFWGSPFTPVFHNWAFMEPRNKMFEHWVKIPHETNVLITHGPPLGILDDVGGGERAGDLDLGVVVRAIKPVVHAFGHIHGQYGIQMHDQTTYINCALLDDAYRLCRVAQTFEVNI